jgi:hypothetical protein
MTTIELDHRKYQLIEELMSINDKETLDKLKEYIHSLKNPSSVAEGQTEYITKAEVLSGINSGLKDVKGGNTRPITDLLNEL